MQGHRGMQGYSLGHDLVVGCAWLDFVVLGIWQVSGNGRYFSQFPIRAFNQDFGVIVVRQTALASTVPRRLRVSLICTAVNRAPSYFY